MSNSSQTVNLIQLLQLDIQWHVNGYSLISAVTFTHQILAVYRLALR